MVQVIPPYSIVVVKDAIVLLLGAYVVLLFLLIGTYVGAIKGGNFILGGLVFLVGFSAALRLCCCISDLISLAPGNSGACGDKMGGLAGCSRLVTREHQLRSQAGKRFLRLKGSLGSA
jgi:hypothetical protein